MTNEDASTEPIKPNDDLSDNDPNYRRAARLLAQKLGVDWRDLPRAQVVEYAHKIEIARRKSPPRNSEQ